MSLNFSAPLVRSAVLTAVAMVGLSGAGPDPGDVNAMLNAIPKPLPGYVRHSDPNAFAEVLAIQHEQERKKRLRRMG